MSKAGISMGKIDAYLTLIRSISNKTRFLILSMLFDKEPRRWSNFMKELNITNKRDLWFHLHKLEDVKLIEKRDGMWWLSVGSMEHDYIMAIVGIINRRAK